jgi:L-rhamnose mutarotase
MNQDSEVLAFRMVLNPGMADEYRRRHDEIWPELRDALFAAGVIDYRIFLDPGTQHLFAVMTRRRDHSLHTLRDSALMRRWWAMMSDIMATNPDRSPSEETLLPMFALE